MHSESSALLFEHDPCRIDLHDRPIVDDLARPVPLTIGLSWLAQMRPARSTGQHDAVDNKYRIGRWWFRRCWRCGRLRHRLKLKRLARREEDRPRQDRIVRLRHTSIFRRSGRRLEIWRGPTALGDGIGAQRGFGRGDPSEHDQSSVNAKQRREANDRDRDTFNDREHGCQPVHTRRAGRRSKAPVWVSCPH